MRSGRALGAWVYCLGLASLRRAHVHHVPEVFARSRSPARADWCGRAAHRTATVVALDNAARDATSPQQTGHLTNAQVEHDEQSAGGGALTAPLKADAPLVAQMTLVSARLLWVAAALALVAGMPALAVAVGVVVV